MWMPARPFWRRAWPVPAFLPGYDLSKGKGPEAASADSDLHCFAVQIRQAFAAYPDQFEGFAAGMSPAGRRHPKIALLRTALAPWPGPWT